MAVRVTRFVGHSLVAAAGACLLATALPAGAVGPAAVPSAGGVPAHATYVALGDSYSAGFGIAPSSNEPIPACAQSAHDFPRQVAQQLDLTLTDVTCSGAESANIDLTPQTVFAENATGSAPLQDTALSADTRIVSVTIGGNDLGFSAIAEQCFALSATGPVAGPTGASSPFQSDDCVSFLATSTQTQLTTVVAPALTRVFGHIRDKAPNAEIFVVEYPALAPTAANTPTGGCFRAALGPSGIEPPYPADSYPFTDADVPFLQQLQADLVTTIDSAARAAGAHVVPAFAASDSHSPCAATDDQWVNGITISDIDLSSVSVQTVPGALHPNPAGVDFLTQQLSAAITAAFPTTPTTPTGGSTPPASGSPTASAPELAATGAMHGAPLTWTALGLLAAGAVVLAAERRARLRRAGGHADPG